MPPQNGNPRPPMQDPSRPMPLQPLPQEPKRRHIGGLIFYTVFFACILLIYTFTYFKLGDLQDWLVRYESAQPTKKYQEVFHLYFEDPNWGLLYDNAGVKESAFEGRDAYIAYMEEKVGDQPLTCLETSAGLSKDKKYIVRLGDEKVASFTLTDKNLQAGETGAVSEIPEIPNWQLGTIELFYEGAGTYYVQTLEGQKVQVNGVPLEETNTVQMVTSKANEYLPEGVTAPTSLVHQVDGLMVKPTVTVTDAAGKTVETAYDEETHTFTVPALQEQQIGEAEKKVALEALKTYAMYMSVKGGMENELAQYFQRGTEVFKTITSMERNWNQRYKDHNFTDDGIKDYVRYNDELFSARVTTTLHLVRSDNTEKVNQLDQSMFFKKVDGQWKCFEMTAVDVSGPVTKVKLTFKNEDQILKSDFLDASATQVECPAVTAPAGKNFAGWMVEERKPNGDRVMRLVLQPNENNVAAVTGGELKPMVLMPLFE